MPRPDFVCQSDIERWDEIIESDEYMPKKFADSPELKEVVFAGIWLAEELIKLDCPDSLLVRIQYTAGMISFGRDPWDISQMLLDGYKKGELDIEPEPGALVN
jgi:hypothetical protein